MLKTQNRITFFTDPAYIMTNNQDGNFIELIYMSNQTVDFSLVLQSKPASGSSRIRISGRAQRALAMRIILF